MDTAPHATERKHVSGGTLVRPLPGFEACPIANREMLVQFCGASFEVELAVPREMRGVVVLARANGNVIRQRPIATLLHESGFATAECQVLTWCEREHEFARHGAVTNVDLLTDRLIRIVDAIREEPGISEASIGLLGSGTLAASMLQVGARRPLDIDAIVSRDGRVGLARDLEFVRAATLFVVAAGHAGLARENDGVYGRLRCARRFDLLGGASGDSDRNAVLAGDLTREWFLEHLGAAVFA